MQEAPTSREIDRELLEELDSMLLSELPHLDERSDRVLNPTPLIDLTADLIRCARSEYGIDISKSGAKVYGKLDSRILGGSVKVRPAVQIIRRAVANGDLRRGQSIFEATSGNFGLALGLFRRWGFDVYLLVSRKLQEGVLDQLSKDGLKLVNLDIDICPAPGIQMDPNLVVAKGVAANVREQLSQLGLDVSIYDRSIGEVEALLAKQDVINLAKLLAKIYGGFCPEQYDNVSNVEAHETVTGPELEQQLLALGERPGEFDVICAFGTGGTSGGLSRYAKRRYHRKNVRVVFPLKDQDVAGIRTREKAQGLRFYEPDLYSGQHEVDFGASLKTLRFFARGGLDLGESSALGLYACIQLLNFGVGTSFAVMLADGIGKYTSDLELAPNTIASEVTLEQAIAKAADYGGVLWTHGMFAPSREGIRLVASSLGLDEERIGVVPAGDVRLILNDRKTPERMQALLPKDGRPVLLVCMAGGTSLAVAKILGEKGVQAQSLIGGIGELSARGGMPLPRLVEAARQ